MGDLVSITDHLQVYRGNINVGIVGLGNSCVLFDLGDGSVLEHLGDRRVERVAFTHHHRDQACGLVEFEEGAVVGVPEAERWLFEDVGGYWEDPANRWHLYNFHPHHLTLSEGVEVGESYADGQNFQWGPAVVSVLSTPGHTDGSLSYLVDVDGKRTCFSGDLIHDGEGRIWEMWSLQKGTATTDYHGFMGSMDEVTTSLRRIIEYSPDLIIPSHGEIIDNPGDACELLEGRLDSCYDAWASTSSLRHYFPQLYGKYLRGEGVLPIREGIQVPGCLRHIGTTWLLISQSGSCFAMDCGSEQALDGVKALRDKGDFGDIEGLWITHYHDDHVDFAPRFREEFSCEILAEEHVAEVIEEPLAWRLPCISPVGVPVDRRLVDGEEWKWQEFHMKAFHLPGQTLYSGGLLVDGLGKRMLFSGDSFTPGGTDDHCCGNRNILGKGLGYDRCIDIVRRFRPTHIFNAHVQKAFRFDEGQLDFIERTRARRLKLFSDLLPWDDPNYGIDENWIRCYPYEQVSRPGDIVRVRVVAMNHSTSEKKMSCRLVSPVGWGDGGTGETMASPGEESEIELSLSVPGDADKRLHVLPVDVSYGSMYMPQLAEAILRVE